MIPFLQDEDRRIQKFISVGLYWASRKTDASSEEDTLLLKWNRTAIIDHLIRQMLLVSKGKLNDHLLVVSHVLWGELA